MTDSVDRDDNQLEVGRSSEVDSRVPGDTDWDLQIQVPFDDGEVHDLTSAIIVGVAKTEGVSPVDVKEPPLYEVLDVAALEDSFFGSAIIGNRSSEFRSVEFMYRNHRVVVRNDAWVQIFDPADRSN